MARRLEPTVFLAMLSPVTVALVAGAAAITVVSGGHWLAAAAIATLVWVGRVVIARRYAKRLAALPRRIDPFALREPWRFFVRDAVQARNRFAASLDRATAGPLRDRLLEIGESLDRGVTQCWESARKGQRLTDARRSIDAERLRRELAALPGDDPRRTSLDAQLASHRRLADREQATEAELERLEVRFDEAVVRATELGTRTGALDDLDSIGHSIDEVVLELEALRLGLDDVEAGP